MFFKNQLFDGFHTVYIIGSLLLTGLILYFAKYIKNNRNKEKFLLFWAAATFLLHLSPLWIDFLKGESAIAVDNMLFPIYFCNLAMLMLLLTSLFKDKTTKAFKIIATSTAYSGIIGALVSLIYPDYYVSTDAGMTFGILKSMLSHSTMLVGSIYLFSGNFIKVDKNSTKYFIYGLLSYGMIGAIVNIIFYMFGLPNPNAMYLQASAIEEVPFLNGYVIAFIVVLVVFGINRLILKYKDKLINCYKEKIVNKNRLNCQS